MVPQPLSTYQLSFLWFAVYFSILRNLNLTGVDQFLAVAGSNSLLQKPDLIGLARVEWWPCIKSGMQLPFCQFDELKKKCNKESQLYARSFCFGLYFSIFFFLLKIQGSQIKYVERGRIEKNKAKESKDYSAFEKRGAGFGLKNYHRTPLRALELF